MIGRIRRGSDPKEAPHVLVAGTEARPIAAGTRIKVKLRDEWWRGRYEYDAAGGRVEGVLFTGDKRFFVPDGSEAEVE